MLNVLNKGLKCLHNTPAAFSWMRALRKQESITCLQNLGLIRIWTPSCVANPVKIYQLILFFFFIRFNTDNPWSFVLKNIFWLLKFTARLGITNKSHFPQPASVLYDCFWQNFFIILNYGMLKVTSDDDFTKGKYPVAEFVSSFRDFSAFIPVTVHYLLLFQSASWRMYQSCQFCPPFWYRFSIWFFHCTKRAQ